MKAYGEVEVYAHTFLTSALDGGDRAASHPSHEPPANRKPDTPLYMRLGESQNRPGFRGEQEDLGIVLGTEHKFLRCLDHTPITILSPLSSEKNHFMKYGVKSMHEMNILRLISVNS
jgi:hypothetical protein